MKPCAICLAPDAHWTIRGLHTCEVCASLLEDVGVGTATEQPTRKCPACKESMCACSECNDDYIWCSTKCEIADFELNGERSWTAQ
jgi:hypothetical protein